MKRLIKNHGKDLSTNDFTDGYKKKIDSMQTLYKFRGTVDSIDDLSIIQNANVGDVYRNIANAKDYIWNGNEWIEAGENVNFTTILKEIAFVKCKLKITSNNIGEEIALPCNYKVGQNSLDIFLNGERLLLSSDDIGTDGHYREIGNNNSISNKIKLTTDWKLEIGDVLGIVVKGEYNDTE